MTNTKLQVKHTPAPWLQKHRKGSDGNYRTEIFSEEYGGIAICEWTPQNLGNGVTGTYREANARLIAAAPDLLQALKELAEAGEEAWGGNRPCVRDALSAIAKAEGKA